MKRILPVFSSLVFAFVFVLIFVNSSAVTFAQIALPVEPETVSQDQTEAGSTSKMIAPDYYPRPNGPLPFAGQNHSYSVVLRGNGEAIITLKVALTNSSPEGTYLRTANLRLPSRIRP